MRWPSTILAAISCILLIITLFYYARSYSRFEGYLRNSEGAPTTVTATANNRTATVEISGRSTGWFTYRGQLTWVSVANPMREDLEANTWSVPIDHQRLTGPMMLVYDARNRTGLRWGTLESKEPLTNPVLNIGWLLPYRFFTIPYWLLALLFAIGPYLWVRNYLAESKVSAASQSGPSPAR